MATTDTNYIHAYPTDEGVKFSTPGCGCCKDFDEIKDKDEIVIELLLLSRSNFREAIMYRMMAEAYATLDLDIALEKINSIQFSENVEFLVKLFEAKVEINE